MSRLSKVSNNKTMRQARVRATVVGTKERPRLSVRISNKHVLAQIIDDSSAKTLAAVTTVGSKQAKGTMTERSVWVGEEIAKQAKKHKIKHVAFDRGSKLFHGRVKALADAARKEGLEF